MGFGIISSSSSNRQRNLHRSRADLDKKSTLFASAIDSPVSLPSSSLVTLHPAMAKGRDGHSTNRIGSSPEPATDGDQMATKIRSDTGKGAAGLVKDSHGRKRLAKGQRPQSSQQGRSLTPLCKHDTRPEGGKEGGCGARHSGVSRNSYKELP